MSASGPVLAGGIDCQGNEERLQDCQVKWWGEGTCLQAVRYANVECTGELSTGTKYYLYSNTCM